MQQNRLTNTGLSIELVNDIKRIADKYHAKKIILFGSRARGDYQERSDIDLAVYGIIEQEQALFNFDVLAIPTFLEFDLVHITVKIEKPLLENIERDGILIMEKLTHKVGQYSNAISRLKESIEEYTHTHSTSVRDGAIQRFEFTCELAWKSAREYLLDQGFVDINSPKSVMRKAYSYGLLDNETGWIQLLNDRNSTSHVYSEETAMEIYQRIAEQHVLLFESLLEKLRKN